MLISIINRTQHEHGLSDADVQQAVRAINRQLAEDFEPHWQFGARLRLDASFERTKDGGEKALVREMPQRRGDAVVYLVDGSSVADAEGYHDRNGGDVPCGFVSLDACRECNDPWQMTLSHEVLELVGDPMANLMVQGPHPHERHKLVFHTFELCDPVQADSYEIDGVPVSNFVLPAWFTRGDAVGGRNDFIGRRRDRAPLESFRMAPGGYLCYWDPQRDGDKWTHVMADAQAESRLAAKAKTKLGRMRRLRHVGR